MSASKQIQSPASAGSRGLAKTTQFTNDRTQMQMGNSPIAESMVEIRNILNRIDGVNVPTDEAKSGITDANYKLLMLDISAMKDRISELNIDDDSKTRALTALGDVEDELNFDESAVREDLDYRSEDILNKAGFDPADIDTYMKVFNDHGDTSDLDQMNMKEKVGLAEVMSMVLASHGIQNESYEPFPEEDEMTFDDDDAFYEAFGELGFPEDETELFDAEYRGRKVPLNKPMRGDVKKFKVYVKDPKTGNVKKVNFGHGGSSARKAGQKTMKIRKSNPKARKSFRARHNCANPGPKTKARYWSCKAWR